MSQFPRVEQLLGGRLDSVEFHQIAALEGNVNAAEGGDLDYKGFGYEYSSKEKTKPEKDRKDWGDELAKDVCAFANSRGGVIILGMHEINGVPSRRNPIGLNDKTRREYQDVVAARTEPRVQFATHPVPNPDNPSEGFLLLVVPRSLQGPHAAHGIRGSRTDGYIRCPVRSDSGTTFLSQSENIEAAMQRLTTLDRRSAERDALELQAATAAFADVPYPRLLVSLMPTVAGEMDLNTRSLATFTNELTAEPLWLAESGHTFDEVSPSSSGLTASMYSKAAREIHGILGTDGTGVLAYSLRLSGNPIITIPGPMPAKNTLSDGEVCGMVLSALGVLARHAVNRTSTLGACEVRVRIVVSIGAMPGVDDYIARRDDEWPVALGGHGSQRHALASVGALMEGLAVPGSHLVQTTHKLLSRISHCFGQPESPYTSAAGALIRDKRTTFFPGGLLYEWAEKHGIDVVDWQSAR